MLNPPRRVKHLNVEILRSAQDDIENLNITTD
jgi:hypothetical protein